MFAEASCSFSNGGFHQHSFLLTKDPPANPPCAPLQSAHKHRRLGIQQFHESRQTLTGEPLLWLHKVPQTFEGGLGGIFRKLVQRQPTFNHIPLCTVSKDLSLIGVSWSNDATKPNPDRCTRTERSLIDGFSPMALSTYCTCACAYVRVSAFWLYFLRPALPAAARPPFSSTLKSVLRTLFPADVTFGEGAMGMVVQAVKGLPVVSRFQATAQGAPGAAVQLGVSLGSIVLGVDRGPGSVDMDGLPSFADVFRAISVYKRPVRLALQRLASLHGPTLPGLPLVLWEGGVGLLPADGGGAELAVGAAVMTLDRTDDAGYAVRVDWPAAGVSLVVLDEAEQSAADLHPDARLRVEGVLHRSPTAASAAINLYDLQFSSVPQLVEVLKVLALCRVPRDLEAQADGLPLVQELLTGPCECWAAPFSGMRVFGNWKKLCMTLRRCVF